MRTIRVVCSNARHRPNVLVAKYQKREEDRPWVMNLDALHRAIGRNDREASVGLTDEGDKRYRVKLSCPKCRRAVPVRDETLQTIFDGYADAGMESCTLTALAATIKALHEM